MTTESSRSSGDSYTQRHQEALELEVSLLEATLRRNRASQNRTQYFRRAQMAYKCCCLQQDHRLDRLWADWQSFLRDDLPTQLELVRKRKQRKQRDDRWEMAVQTPSTTTTEEDAVFHNTNERLLGLLRQLCTRTTHGVAECRSRIEHYARAATAEIVRGFFLPLLTVLTGCLARIRVLLQRLQRQVAQTIRQEVLLKYDDDGDAAGNNELWKLVRPLLENVVETITTMATADAETMRILQKQQDGNWTRSELTAASLRSLGIQYSTTSSTASASTTPQSMVDNDGTGKSSPQNDVEDNDDVKKPTAAWSGGGGTEEALSLAMSTTTATNVDDNDIGESVAGVATMLRDDDDSFIAVSTTNNSQRTGKPHSTVHKDDAGVDRNAVVLQKIKEQQVATDQKQKKRDRKEKRRAANGSSKPMKKGKKKKGGDFFDALFG